MGLRSVAICPQYFFEAYRKVFLIRWMTHVCITACPFSNGRAIHSAISVLTVVKSVPYGEAQVDRLLATGDTVWIDCVVDQQDGRWKPTDEQGWLLEDEVIPSPHSGKSSSPRCPD